MQTEGRDQFNGGDSRSHRWGLILAGGDGKRLLPLTRRIAGDDRPKQFCAVLGNETLLHQTQRRVSRLIQPWRTLLVLTSAHEPFYADEVAGIPSSRLLIQPSNQGTAPAILYSLLRLREMDPKGVVAFFPSDHHFSDDEAFTDHIDSAYAAVASRPEVVILLGIPPETPEVEYGWIEPGDPSGAASAGLCLAASAASGKNLPRNACFALDGARLSVEQLRDGGSRSRFPESVQTRASRPAECVRGDSTIVVYSARKSGDAGPLLRHSQQQLFSGRPIDAGELPGCASSHRSRLE